MKRIQSTLKYPHLFRLSALSFSLAVSPLAMALVEAPGTTRIEIEMSAEAREGLKASVKTEVDNVTAQILQEGKLQQRVQVSINSRGQTSLKKYPRKNFQLLEKDPNQKGLRAGQIEGKSLILSSGSMDPLLIKNMISYRLFDGAQVTSLKTGYAEVVLNGESQGLYMVTLNPEQMLLKEKKADIVLRRRYKDTLQVSKAQNDLSDEAISTYKTQLDELHARLSDLKGQELLTELSKQMNIDAYLRLVAVNYILQNGDYADEIFFFGRPGEKGRAYFDVMPWDLDDTFADSMHLSLVPGGFNTNQEQKSRRQMIYGFESRLDQAISQDPVLLKKYFEVLAQVSAQLTDQKIDAIVNSVRQELSPYLEDQDILSSGKLDAEKKNHDPVAAISNLDAKKSFLKSRLQEIRSELAIIQAGDENRSQEISKIERKMGDFILKIAVKYSN